MINDHHVCVVTLWQCYDASSALGAGHSATIKDRKSIVLFILLIDPPNYALLSWMLFLNSGMHLLHAASLLQLTRLKVRISLLHKNERKRHSYKVRPLDWRKQCDQIACTHLTLLLEASILLLHGICQQNLKSCGPTPRSGLLIQTMQCMSVIFKNTKWIFDPKKTWW